MVTHSSCVDVAVLVGVSTACSMSSCLTISSASNAWSGESEPEEAEKKKKKKNGKKKNLRWCHSELTKKCIFILTCSPKQLEEGLIIVKEQLMLDCLTLKLVIKR